MKNIFLISIFITVSLASCNKKVEKIETKTVSDSFNAFLDNYNTENYKMYPINATYAGVNGYNDQLPNNLTTEYSAHARHHRARSRQCDRRRGLESGHHDHQCGTGRDLGAPDRFDQRGLGRGCGSFFGYQHA